MEIQLVKGVGEGSTKLSAFHAALMDAGVGRLNLIQLSSVVPRETEIKDIGKLSMPDKEHGYFQYAVYSKQVSAPKVVSCAGIGWIQYPDNRGYFVEHHGNSEKDVKQLIKTSLTDMLDKDKDLMAKFHLSKREIKIHNYIVEARSNDKYSCAFVGALYKREKPF